MTRRTSEFESSLPRLPRGARRIALAASAALALLSACGSPDGGPSGEKEPVAPKASEHKATATGEGSGTNAFQASPTTAAAAGFGTIGFDLQLGSATVDSGSYQITGNNFTANGPIDVAQATSVSVIVGGIPFGTGYQATLNASSSKGLVLTCTGTATFDVASTAMSTVTVSMDCKESPAVPVPPGASLALGVLIAASGMVMLRGAARPRRRVA